LVASLRERVIAPTGLGQRLSEDSPLPLVLLVKWHEHRHAQIEVSVGWCLLRF
jgi:hypothetical protein